MCASYMIKKRNPKGIGLELDVRVDIENYTHDRILPYRMAPVITAHQNDLVLEEKQFSMIPSWSKEKRVKFATHNARIETIDQKPTWKEPFIKRHCLVPMTHFIEPIYEGPYAGNLVSISTEDEQFICAAGVWDDWVNKETGEVISSFTIITRDPPKFIDQMGHDRCPLFLSNETGVEWLHAENKSALELKKLLLNETQIQEFHVEKYKEMKPGWEKRK